MDDGSVRPGGVLGDWLASTGAVGIWSAWEEAVVSMGRTASEVTPRSNPGTWLASALPSREVRVSSVGTSCRTATGGEGGLWGGISMVTGVTGGGGLRSGE